MQTFIQYINEAKKKKETPSPYPHRYTDEKGIEWDKCIHCGDDVSTHPHDAAGGLGYCGDCGHATCATHRTHDGAERCPSCAKKQVTEGCVNFSDYNLEHKFNHYNQILFDNSIPQCPIVWNDKLKVGSKSAFGLTTFTHRGREVVPGTMKMEISSRFKREEEALDSTLIHEMIHAYWAIHGYPEEQHGMRFKSMAYHCQKITGIAIPVTDTSQDLELAVAKDVDTTVLFRQYPGGWYAIFYSGNAFDDPKRQDELKAFWGYPGKMNPGEEILVVKVRGSFLEKYGSSRTIKQDTWRGVSKAETEEILQRGQIMFKIAAGSVSKELATATMPTKEALVVTRTNTRTHETITSLYVPQIARDSSKLQTLKDYWQSWHKMGYDVDMFLTHSSIFNLGFKMQREPKSGAFYRMSADKIENLRQHANYIERWHQ